MAILLTPSMLARNLLRWTRRRNTFRIAYWCLSWDSNPGSSSIKPTHYLLDHGDFVIVSFFLNYFSKINTLFSSQKKLAPLWSQILQRKCKTSPRYMASVSRCVFHFIITNHCVDYFHEFITLLSEINFCVIRIFLIASFL